MVRTNDPELIQGLLGAPDGDASEAEDEMSALYVYRGRNAGYFIAYRESLWHKAKDEPTFAWQLKGACEALIMERTGPLVRLPGRLDSEGRVELFVSADEPPSADLRRDAPLPLVLLVGQPVESPVCPLAERLALGLLVVGSLRPDAGLAVAMGHARRLQDRWALDRAEVRRPTSASEALLAILGGHLRFGDSLDQGVSAIERLLLAADALEIAADGVGPDGWAQRSKAPAPVRLPDLTGEFVRERRARGAARALDYPLVRTGLVEREVRGGTLLAGPWPPCLHEA